jgi:copper chaperone CopZ
MNHNVHAPEIPRPGSAGSRRTTLHVGGIYRGSEHLVVEKTFSRLPGVLAVDANPVAQTATVTDDPASTSVRELRDAVEAVRVPLRGLLGGVRAVRPARRRGAARSGA